jgi:hypothetical protein
MYGLDPRQHYAPARSGCALSPRRTAACYACGRRRVCPPLGAACLRFRLAAGVSRVDRQTTGTDETEASGPPTASRLHSSDRGRPCGTGHALAGRLYEEGPVVKQRLVVRRQGPLVSRGCGATLMSLWPPRWEDQAKLDVRSRAHVQKGDQAARRKVAPRGANFWLRVSMCQIACASRRAMSIWAILAPRCLPSRFLLRW